MIRGSVSHYIDSINFLYIFNQVYEASVVGSIISVDVRKNVDIINQNIKLYKRDSSLIKIEYVDMALLCEKLNICHDNLSSGTIYNFLTQKPLTSKTNHDAASDSQEVAKAFKFLINPSLIKF